MLLVWGVRAGGPAGGGVRALRGAYFYLLGCVCVYVSYLYVFICQGTSRRWRVRAAWCIFLPPWLCVLFLCCICMCLYARGPACRGVCEQCVVRIFTSLALCVYVCVCVRVCVCVYVLKDQPAMACKHCVVRTLPPCCL